MAILGIMLVFGDVFKVETGPLSKGRELPKTPFAVFQVAVTR